MDFIISSWINQRGRGTLINQISFFISWFPIFVGIFVIIFGFLYWKFPTKRKQILFAWIVGTILFFLINELLAKYIMVEYVGMRIRPYLAYPEHIIPTGAQMMDNSFPSSHMASTTMVMTLMVWMIPWLRPYALMFTLAMAFSRIHNGMHYPTDVLAWAFLGILYGLLGIWISTKRRYQKK
jgi:membrane-associated phospholipid phosphatase